MANAVLSKDAQEIESIAKKLVEKCRKQEFESAIQELYAQDNCSVEAGQKTKETKGIKAILQHNKQWLESTEIRSMQVSDPMVSDTHFAVKFSMDAVDKKSKEQYTSSEIGIYEVKNGKIIREEFFYAAD